VPEQLGTDSTGEKRPASRAMPFSGSQVRASGGRGARGGRLGGGV